MSNEYKVDGIERIVAGEGGTPFPLDEVKKGVGIVGQTINGEILFVLPPTAIAGTFFLLYPNHLPFSCEFVNSMAAHMGTERMVDAIEGLDDKAINNMLERLLKRHNVEKFDPTMVHDGKDSSTFDGMYYGVMSTLDLAAIVVVMEELWKVVPDSVKDATPEVTRIVAMWVEAGKGMLTDKEKQAVLLMDSHVGNA